MSHGQQQAPWWTTIKSEYFWNYPMAKDLFDAGLQEWVGPIIQGYVGVRPFDVAEHNCELILISRRKRFRAGTRYKRRGIDDDGYCANYVETEQIIAYRTTCMSFIIVRGSIPVFWSQEPETLEYRPPAHIDRKPQETNDAFMKHIGRQINDYKSQMIINLIAQHGREWVCGALSSSRFLHSH